jgi:hypothetical protein
MANELVVLHRRSVDEACQFPSFAAQIWGFSGDSLGSTLLLQAAFSFVDLEPG